MIIAFIGQNEPYNSAVGKAVAVPMSILLILLGIVALPLNILIGYFLIQHFLGPLLEVKANVVHNQNLVSSFVGHNHASSNLYTNNLH